MVLLNLNRMYFLFPVVIEQKQFTQEEISNLPLSLSNSGTKSMVGNGYPETWIVTTHNDRNEKQACCTNFSMIFPYDVVPENILKNIRKNVCKEHFEYIIRCDME